MSGARVRRNLLERFKRRIRETTRRAEGVSMRTTIEGLAPYTRGWLSYFGFCETLEVLWSHTRWVRLQLRGRHVAAVENTAPSPGSTDRARPGPPLPSNTGTGQSSLCWAFQCLLQVARAAVIVRASIGVTISKDVYDPVRLVVWQGAAGNRRPYASLVAWRLPICGSLAYDSFS